MIQNPSELRYFDTKRLDQERAIIYGYFQDAIRAYGKDVKYYKMSNEITNDGKENSELGYGFDPHRRIDKVANLRTYINFDSYNFQFNQFGFEPKAELVFFFSLNDFAVNFIDDLGKFRKFDVKKVHRNIEYNGERTFRIPFETEITSGIAKFDIPEGYLGGFIDGIVTDYYDPVYKIETNPYTHRTFTSDYHGNFFVPSIRARFLYGKHSGVDYDLEGSILYSGYQEARSMSDVIRPMIGDIIEIPYDTEDGHVEQYEISQVLDRLPTTGNSISPLLGRYVWRCHAVRRIVSTGDAVEQTPESVDSQDGISTYIENREKMNRRENYDWKQSGDDDRVYGSFDTDPKYDLNQDRDALSEDYDGKEDSKITSKEVLDPETLPGWKVIAVFKDGTAITTDGKLLFYEFRNRKRVLVSGFKCDWSVNFNREYLERAYLFNINNNLCFVDKDKKIVKITTFDEDVPVVDGNPQTVFYEDDVAEMHDNWYIFSRSKMALYSKNGELVCVSKDGEEEVVASLEKSPK